MRSRHRFLVSFVAFIVLPLIPRTSVPQLKEGAHIPAGKPPGNPIPAVDSLPSSRDNFLWPTDATHIVTSTFGEYRHTHFHGGIDISTKNTTGFKVFAAQDGYVWRIQVSPNGYGKMLYLRHPGGYVTTYAHLKTFNEQINGIVRAEQLRLERYPVEIILDSALLKTNRGDVIAYTGSSGIGTPHLHFEVLDENLNPLDPMAFPALHVNDSLGAEVRSISISPLDENSVIGKSHRPVILRPLLKQRQMYHVAQKLSLRGRIGLGINARERISGTYHRVGLHRLEFYLDDSASFAMQMDRIAADDAKHIMMVYDFSLLRAGRGKFQKLYTDRRASRLAHGRMTLGDGVIDTDKLTEGVHRFRIVTRDLNGNTTEVNGQFLSRPQPLMPPTTISATAISPDEKKDSNGTHPDVCLITPGSPGWFSFDNGGLEVVYDSASVFEPLTLTVQRIQPGKNPVYRLEPRNVLLDRGIRVFVKHPGTPNGRTAIYFRENRRWELRPTFVDTSTGYLSTTLAYTLGDISIFEDTRPPAIASVRLNVSRKKPSIRFTLHDDRSGIDANEIKMYIDDVFAVPETDGEHWRVTWEGDRQLGHGTHKLRIVVKDRMKNEASVTRTFAVH